MPIVFDVQARPDHWQTSPVSLAPGETAHITASGAWGVIDPTRRGLTGPGGNDVPGGPTFIHSNPAKEGCLLVRDGSNQAYFFPSDTAEILVHVPGPVCFMANDDPTPSGHGHNGFADNTGALKVSITITRP